MTSRDTGPKLAEELRRVGAEIKKQAEKELAEFYPRDSGWRDANCSISGHVRCVASRRTAVPRFRCVRSFWLCKKTSPQDGHSAIRSKDTRKKANSRRLSLKSSSQRANGKCQSGTVARAKARCPACNMVLATADACARSSQAQRGGAEVVFDVKGQRTGGARLLAVVLLKVGRSGPPLPAADRTRLRGGARGTDAARANS